MENSCWMGAQNSFTFFKLSNYSKIMHLNASGIKIDILTIIFVPQSLFLIEKDT